MSTGLRTTFFVLALAGVFGVAAIAGWAVGPVDDEPESHTTSHADDDAGEHSDNAGEHSDNAGEHSDDAGHAAESGTGAELPGGLLIAQAGYSFDLAEATVRAGDAAPVAFTITGPDGQPVTAFDVAHEKELHLIAVRRDLSGFQHVHPRRDRDGTWRVDLDLTPGTWRLFADFAATGAEPLTLGADLTVRGVTAQPAQSTQESEVRTSTVDGYQVELIGDLSQGDGSLLTLRVSKDGEPVADLQPYLGALGHLVVLRAGDLAYLHAHPEATDAHGPDVGFHVTAPSRGRYHLYLDFQHGGVVRTATFTLAVDDARDASQPGPEEDQHEHSH